MEKKKAEDFVGKAYKIGLANGLKAKLFKIAGNWLIASEFETAPSDEGAELLTKFKNSEFFDGSFDAHAKNPLLKVLKKRKQVLVK